MRLPILTSAIITPKTRWMPKLPKIIPQIRLLMNLMSISVIIPRAQPQLLIQQSTESQSNQRNILAIRTIVMSFQPQRAIIPIALLSAALPTTIRQTKIRRRKTTHSSIWGIPARQRLWPAVKAIMCSKSAMARMDIIITNMIPVSSLFPA